MGIKPYRQGHLDSLCGIYSILNAYRIVNKVSSLEAQYLFNDIVRYFSKKRLLKDILIDGMGMKEMSMVMNEVVYPLMPDFKLSWASFPNPTTRQFWKSIQEHLSKEDTAIILGTTGNASHWSTGISCTSRTIRLLDGEWKYLRYINCSTQYDDSKLYILYPAQTFFITRSKAL